MLELERHFDHKDINTQVMTLNETILNVFRNYVPNKYITIGDKDTVWMNETIKSNVKQKINFTNSILIMADLKVTLCLLKL